MEKNYKNPEDAPLMASESIPLALTKGQSEQVEALWTLIKNQGTLVQEVLFERLSSYFKKETLEIETAQHVYVKESLHRAFDNMRKAELKAGREQTLDEFLEEL